MNFLTRRTVFALISVIGLGLVYFFQHFNYLEFFTGSVNFHANFTFAFNRIIRFILNDFLAILLIYAIFYKMEYVKIAFLVQIFGLFVLIPLYLYFKLTLEGDTEISSPLLSYLHRIIIHPFLIFLLIPAFFMYKIR